MTSQHPAAGGGAAGVLASWPGDASCPRSAALGHRAASRDPSPSLGRQPWGPSQLSPPPPAHRGAPWGQPCHTSGRRGQEWARCPRAPWDLWCANWSLSSTFHCHLEEKRGQWTQWSITATQPAQASGRIPEALPVWPTSFLQPSRHLHTDILVDAAGPWFGFWSQEVTAAQRWGRFSLGHKTMCVGSGEVCHLPVL